MSSPSVTVAASAVDSPANSPDDQGELSCDNTGAIQGDSAVCKASSKSGRLGKAPSSALLTDGTVAKPPHTPRGTASNSFRRKVCERRVVTDASGCTEAKTNACAYWSPSAPENKTGARIGKDG